MVKSTATTPSPIATVTHDRACGQRRPPEGAHGVLDVTDRVVDERGPALVAAFVSGERRRSEARLRPPARLSRGLAFIDQFLRVALDVECELIVQVLLDAVSSEQRARPQFQVAEIHGDQSDDYGVDCRHYPLLVSTVNTKAA